MKSYLISWTETVTRCVAVDAPDDMTREAVADLFWGEIADYELVEAAEHYRPSAPLRDVTLASVDDVSQVDISGPHEQLANSYPVVRLADLISLPVSET